MQKQAAITKITRPRISDVLERSRLFHLLDLKRKAPITWISGPGGSGKTTLVASYLDARKLPCLWYRLDDGDGDIATFFYYMGLAAGKAAPRSKKPLPLLTPEYLLGIPAFTRRYFEELFLRLSLSPSSSSLGRKLAAPSALRPPRPGFILVFDNYQDVPETSPFHEMIKHGLSNIPEDINVIVLSRSAPPLQMSDLSAKSSMETLDWEDLRFTAGESRAMLQIRNRKIPQAALHKIYEKMQGWAAGLVLMTGGPKTAPDMAQPQGDFSRGNIFAYFAGEIVNNLDNETRDFLLTSSFLPDMTVHNAEVIAGNKRAGQILARLSRDNFFIEKHGTTEVHFQYHPLFREYLLNRSREIYPQDHLMGIMQCAAALLETSGRIEDAAELYRLSEDWDKLVPFILSKAAVLMSQGRIRILVQWLKALPPDRREREPWLRYWTAVCRMPFDLNEGKELFTRAFSAFRDRNDTAGIYLAWSGVVESLIHELGDLRQLDPWISILDDLERAYPFPNPGIEARVSASLFFALALRQPHHPKLPAVKERALAIVKGKEDSSLKITTAFYLLSFDIWTGDFVEAEHVVEIMRRIADSTKGLSPLADILVSMSDGWLSRASGSLRDSYETVLKGLDKANDSGVHMWDHMLLVMGIGACIDRNDNTCAESMIEKFRRTADRARPFDRYYYHRQLAKRLVLAKQLSAAAIHFQEAHSIAVSMGLWYAEAISHCTLSLVLRSAGKKEQAQDHLAESYRIARGVKSGFLEFICLLTESSYSFEDSNQERGTALLKDALALGREKGYVFSFEWPPVPLVYGLCLKALESGIEVEQVKKIIRTYNFVPDDPPLHLDNWPWPIKIFTLGGFKLLVDDKPVEFSGKVQKKPLDLLKALIAFGSTDVGEEKITDALWPEAAGDLAHKSFEMALQRLRKLIGRDNAVLLRNGQVSLDNRQCWVDIRAFETALLSADAGMPGENEYASRNPKAEILQRLEKALQTYRGHFLPADTRHPWSAVTRERLRSKFLRLVTKAGEQYEQDGEWKSAVDCFERGLEKDPACEEFYQHLMICHDKLGNRAEAAKTFLRCRSALRHALGIDPSQHTQDIYASLHQGI
jgi:LuxR family maltose regulon positive regulatory protein